MTNDEVNQKLKASEQIVGHLLFTAEFLDEDGYPTETALNIIREWPFSMSQKQLFEFIKSIWWMPDWGWRETDEVDSLLNKEKHYYKISCGGWSGNEDIIQAMQENKWMFWSLSWVQSRRGGHYIFEEWKSESN